MPQHYYLLDTLVIIILQVQFLGTKLAKKALVEACQINSIKEIFTEFKLKNSVIYSLESHAPERSTVNKTIDQVEKEGDSFHPWVVSENNLI